MTLRVLIAGETGGALREAFRAHGCDAKSCDLLDDATGSEHHLKCDWWEIVGNGWDMAIFHPTCTYLTVSAAWAFKDGPYHQKVKPGTLVGAERRAARADALDDFRRILALPFPKAVENPAPSFISTAIRPPDQTIQPYQFGDDASKRTGLWLDRLPILRPTKRIAGRIVNGKERWANQTDSGQNKLSPSDDRWQQRSKTYPGIAAAMAAQWTAHMMEMMQ